MPNQRRNRSKNYSDDEVFLLIDLIDPFLNIIENKTTNKVANDEKASAWEEIARQYNCSTASYRSADLLRQKFDSLKRETRKYCADRNNSKMKAEGCVGKTLLNPIYERMKDLISLSAKGLEFDLTEFFKNHTNSLPSPTEEQCKIDPPANKEPCTWKSYSSDRLQKQTNPFVILTEESIEQPENISDLTEDCTINDVDEFKEQEILEATPRRLPKTFPLPRRMKKKNRLSLSGKQLEPWIVAKTELVRLQMKLLQKKFDSDERRAEELFKTKIKLMVKSNMCSNCRAIASGF